MLTKPAAVNAGVSLAVLVISVLVTNNPAVKASTFLQDDWIGGPGTGTNQYASGDKVVTSNAGSVSVDTSNPDTTDWCNVSSPSGYCDNDWKNRQSITLDNPAASQTDYAVRVAIPYQTAMAPDFKDLRFTNEAGDTGYEYFNSHFISRSKGYFWIKIPSLPNGTTKIYAYYGNTTASSLSDESIVYWTDNFHSGSTLDPIYWSGDSETITDGELYSINHPHMISPTGTGWDTTAQDMTFQYDVRMDTGYCGAWSTVPNGLASGWPSYQSSLIEVTNVDCNSNSFHFTITNDGYAGSNPVEQSPSFVIGNRVTVRVTSVTTGGFRYYYSTNDGISFTEFPDYTPNNVSPANGDALFFSPSPLGGIASNMTVVKSGPDIGFTLGDPQGSSWCSTPNCDWSWPLRKSFSVKNDGDPQTDYQVRVVFTARNNVTDFSDLRFTDESGLQDLPYWVEKTDTESGTGYPRAYVYVKIPNLQPGVTNFYLYHDKSGVSSLSNRDIMLMTDKFSDGVLDNQWGSPNPGGVSINGSTGEATITQGNAGINTGLTNGRPYGVAIDFDIKIDPSNTTCNQDENCPGAFVAINDSSTISFWQHRSSSGPSYYYVFGTEDAQQNTTYDHTTTPLRLEYNQYYHFRMVSNKDGGNDYYYSTDNYSTIEGRQYYKLGNYTSNTGNNQSIYFGSDNWGQRNDTPTFKNIVAHKYDSKVRTSDLGPTEPQGGKVGTLISRVIDVGEKPVLGHINYTANGDVTMKLRSSNNADMSDATDFAVCSYLWSGAPLTASNCVTAGHRYLQYQAIISDSAAHTTELTSVTFDYDNDAIAPDLPTNLVTRKDTGTPIRAIPDGGWVNSKTPYFTWDASSDNGIAGIKGYCLYLGEDNTADPMATAGELKPYTFGVDYKGDNMGGICPFGKYNAELNTAYASTMLQAELQNGHTYYLIIKAVDNMDNVTTTSTQISFKVDADSPAANTIATIPAASGSKIFHVSWITGPLIFYGDEHSGFAGVKYCLSPLMTGGTGCGPDDPNWYGLDHSSGSLYDTSDVIPFENAGFDTVAADADRLDNQYALANFVNVVGIDYAGNVRPFAQGVIVLTQMPAAPPQNLQVTPTSNTQNAFSFTWDQPSFSLGSRAQLEYCWTVNDPIASDAHNCHWTGKNIYSLAQGAYATKQGTNTLYLMTKDITGNYDTSQFVSVDFNATTTAPGPPEDLDSSDASTRSTSAWKIALSWNPPALSGSGVHRYRVYRSTDNVSFTEVGSTAAGNTGFVDTGLSQVLYYYNVKACDNADSCSVVSNTVNRKPTGRFTTPPRLTADTDQPKIRDIGTKKGTVFWYTDRESDSKVAFGTSPGKYFPEEVGNSIQTGNHVVNLTNLQPSTTYYYLTRWTDSDGNTGVSDEKSFTTLPAPTISEVEAKNVSVNSANITFRSKDASKVNIYYGKNNGLGGFQTINTATRESTYNIPLANLDDGVKYTFKLNGVDADGNEYQGNSYSFTTPELPKIANLRFQPIEGEPSSTQKITWTTNVASNSAITYGPQGTKQTDVLDGKMVTEHEVIISDLLDSTAYTLVARSTDAGGNSANSDLQLFTTALDTRPPKMSNISIESTIRGTGNEARGQVIVSWSTDEPATSQVLFGKGQSGELTNASPEDTKLTRTHTVVLSDLSVASIYRVQPRSYDKARNITLGQIQTSIIGRGTDNIFGIVLSALQKIFGVK